MSRKKILLIILIPIFLLLGLLVAQLIIKSKISNVLDNQLPEHVHLNYDGLTVNILLGSIHLNRVKLELYSPDTLLMHTAMEMEALSLKGVGYANFLFNDEIAVRDLELLRPEIKYFPYRLVSNKNASETNKVALNYKLTIENFNILNGGYTQMQQNPDSVKLEVASFNFHINQLVISTETLTHKIPFTYENLAFRSNKLFVDLGPYERLNIANVDLDEKELVLKAISLKSKYSRNEMSRMLTKERDHIDLKIPEAQFSDLDFGFNGARFFLNISQGALNEANLEVYRDKLVQDDLERKKLYSRMLREMPLDLNLAQLKINDGYISYAEQITEKVKPGEIVFTDLNADLKQISNTNKNGVETKIKISALLMDKAPLELNWSFDAQKENDSFLVSGKLVDFNSEGINPFLKSNLRAEANGEINELYFTFSGNAVSSTGDMKMKYQDFGFVVLQKNRIKVNKLLTAIGNIFTNDGSGADPNGYRYGTIYAERDTSKSFFNYLWLNVKEGVLSTLTGSGKQE